MIPDYNTGQDWQERFSSQSFYMGLGREDPPKKKGKTIVNTPGTIIRKDSVTPLQKGDIKTNQFLNKWLGLLDYTPIGSTASFIRNLDEDPLNAITFSVGLQGSIARNRVSLPRAQYDSGIAAEVAEYNRLADNYLDCSDIASSLNRNNSGGYILEMTPKSGKWMTGIEYGSKTEFTYHQVFVKGKYVYDPMFSSKPVLKSDFIKAYQKMNSAGIKILKL